MSSVEEVKRVAEETLKAVEEAIKRMEEWKIEELREKMRKAWSIRDDLVNWLGRSMSKFWLKVEYWSSKVETVSIYGESGFLARYEDEETKTSVPKIVERFLGDLSVARDLVRSLAWALVDLGDGFTEIYRGYRELRDKYENLKAKVEELLEELEELKEKKEEDC